MSKLISVWKTNICKRNKTGNSLSFGDDERAGVCFRFHVCKALAAAILEETFHARIVPTKPLHDQKGIKLEQQNNASRQIGLSQQPSTRVQIRVTRRGTDDHCGCEDAGERAFAAVMDFKSVQQYLVSQDTILSAGGF